MHRAVITQWLESTIQHLQTLSDQGAGVLQVSRSTLAALSRPRFNSIAANREKCTATKSLEDKPQSVPSKDPSLPSSNSPSQPVRELHSDLKHSAFQELQVRALECVKCPNLASSRKNVVFGAGSLDAALLFVGEAPGMEEDSIGQPFVGKAGELLTRIIHAMGLSRETVFIANVLKCRPDTPGKSSGNRKPSPAEMETCLPFLEEQIAIIRPKVMVALGATAIEGLLKCGPIHVTRMRGQWLHFNNIPLMPTYHPAYLLRNDSLTEKRKVWEDMLAVMEKLRLPISQKQRNFFLRAP